MRLKKKKKGKKSGTGTQWYRYSVNLIYFLPWDLYWKEYMFMYGMVITYNKSKDQSGRVANSARGQLKRESEKSPVPVRA